MLMHVVKIYLPLMVTDSLAIFLPLELLLLQREQQQMVFIALQNYKHH